MNEVRPHCGAQGVHRVQVPVGSILEPLEVVRIPGLNVVQLFNMYQPEPEVHPTVAESRIG